MEYNTLISTTDLALQVDNPTWVILDCRFMLADPAKSRQEYRQAHIHGAQYVDLDEDLSGVKIPGVTGRHPLPSVETATKTFARMGIGRGVQVVCYDDAGGALAAARAWWMLRWLGHTAVAVLDGGWQKWLAEELPVRAGIESRRPGMFTAHPHPEKTVAVADVESLRSDPSCRLFDARAGERYHGQNETIDPVAGHIPGAISAPYIFNLNPDLTFRSPATLRRQYQDLLAGIPAENAVTYCGSGVTATHDILAMLVAGFGEGRVYIGSWSEWITNPNHPVEL
jgi:thiosulfate/3-mercaptopyruvate sulfurtransferase